MKRISLVSIALLSILCTSTQARDYYNVPLNYRTHWSPYTQGLVSGFVKYNPYTLKYNSSGLTNYRLKYSPYAFGYNSSGLIDYQIEYNPYALSTNNSGLVSQTSGEFFGIYSYGPVMNIIHSDTISDQCTCNSETNNFSEYAKKINEDNLSARKAALEKQKVQLKKNKEEKANDPSEAIREYLDSKNIKYKTNDNLRIDGETVSINFNIEDANIIIKFWNSSAISGFAENDKYKKDIFDNYLESWENFCVNNIGNSKKVYNIFSDSREDIIKQLSFDENLNSDNVLYASAQNLSSQQ